MREIEYRGQALRSKLWVRGYYWTNENGNHFIRQAVDLNGCFKIADIEVDPKTIGQYTGLKDKNGKEIYEGDIITGTKYPFIDNRKQNYIGIIVFYENVAQFGYDYKCVRKDKRGISNGIGNEFIANENLICEDLEVIGNIVENKELLEE